MLTRRSLFQRAAAVVATVALTPALKAPTVVEAAPAVTLALPERCENCWEWARWDSVVRGGHHASCPMGRSYVGNPYTAHCDISVDQALTPVMWTDQENVDWWDATKTATSVHPAVWMDGDGKLQWRGMTEEEALSAVMDSVGTTDAQGIWFYGDDLVRSVTIRA